MNKPPNLLIVDDEYLSRKYLADLLEEHWPEAKIIASVSNAEDARSYVEQDLPDILFLDIKMPGKNGFQLLEYMGPGSRTKIIFVTAYKQYALNAIKVKAYDYLLKPVDKQEFCNLVDRIKIESTNKSIQTPGFTEEYLEQKLSIHHHTGFQIISLKEIIYLKASNNYTTIHLAGNTSVLVSKTLKEFEGKLKEPWFFRSHKSHIINMHYLDRYSTENGGSLVMKNGDTILISRYRLPEFMQVVQLLTNGLKT